MHKKPLRHLHHSKELLQNITWIDISSLYSLIIAELIKLIQFYKFNNKTKQFCIYFISTTTLVNLNNCPFKRLKAPQPRVLQWKNDTAQPHGLPEKSREFKCASREICMAKDLVTKSFCEDMSVQFGRIFRTFHFFFVWLGPTWRPTLCLFQLLLIRWRVEVSYSSLKIVLLSFPF